MEKLATLCAAPAAAAWVHEAEKLPLYFALVREDPQVDMAVCKMLAPGAKVLMIASGGCTAAALAASGRVSSLHLVDANKGQILLSLLKLYMLSHLPPADRFALLGHASMSASERQERLRDALSGTRRQFAEKNSSISFALEELGPPALLGENGPDRLGRYEVLFAQLRAALSVEQEALNALFASADISEQIALAAPNTALGVALDAAFSEVMSLENLVALFGSAATQNRVQPFAQHFLERTRVALAAFPAADNPYLADLLLGRFTGAALPWLNLSLVEPDLLPEIACSVAPMSTVLQAHKGEFDFVHLSNILDWLSREEAGLMLELAHQALRPGGKVLIRQLNSTLDIPSLSGNFRWLTAEAAALHNCDRSFFYRQLHLGEKT